MSQAFRPRSPGQGTPAQDVFQQELKGARIFATPFLISTSRSGCASRRHRRKRLGVRPPAWTATWGSRPFPDRDQSRYGRFASQVALGGFQEAAVGIQHYAHGDAPQHPPFAWVMLGRLLLAQLACLMQFFIIATTP